MDSITKKSYERFPVIFDQSNNLFTLETVASYTFTCINTVTGTDTSSEIIDGNTSGTKYVQLIVKNGVVGDKHKITVKVTTTLDGLFEKDLILEIADENNGIFTKQPTEILGIKLEFKNFNSILDGDALSTWTITGTNVLYDSDITSSIVDASAIQPDDNSVVVVCKGGVSGNVYRITTKAETTQGYKYQMDVLMSVREK